MFDYLIVRPCLDGGVLTERLASGRDEKTLIVDPGSPVSGNAHDYNKEVIPIHKYGPCIFFINSGEILDYSEHFTRWQCYEQRALAGVDDQLVSIPINYPDNQAHKWIIDYKYLTGQHPKITLVYEFLKVEGDRYYPIPTPENVLLYKKYQQAGWVLTDTHFVRRLSTYKYYNMDQVFA